MRYTGQALAMEKTGNPGVGSQVWGLQGAPGGSRGLQRPSGSPQRVAWHQLLGGCAAI